MQRPCETENIENKNSGMNSSDLSDKKAC